jgi:hypothetical protein
MTAELEVDAGCLRLFQMVGLVVKQNSECAVKGRD